jgi:hypothetical protein
LKSIDDLNTGIKLSLAVSVVNVKHAEFVG